MRQARSPAAMGFSGHDRRRLQRALRQLGQVHWYQRVQAVLALAQGQSPGQVARLTGRSRRVIHLWRDRYLRRHRVEDLADAPRSGRPPVARVLTRRRLVREFEKDPLKLGYAATTWTAALLAGHLSRCYRCGIGPRTLRRRMKALGLVWKRPRHVYHNRAGHIAQKKGALCGGCGV